jgi:hypothetical protein
MGEINNNELLGPVDHTGRGFELIEFTDRNDQKCTLQQSSAADYVQPGSSAIWLGVGETRMHLSLVQVEHLIGRLNNWVKTGSFK